MRSRRTLLLAGLASGIGICTGIGSLGCAEMKQNLRGQELSFRGTYFCDSPACGDKAMTKSASGTKQGMLQITDVKLQPRAALFFTAATPFDGLVANVTDCKGNNAPIADAQIRPPGKHNIGDSTTKESWVVVVNRNMLPDTLVLGDGDCAIWTVKATGTWSDGATYSYSAAIRVTE